MSRKPDRTIPPDALVSLIQERGYEVLSVQDIIDRANVGRATFYSHFDNKEDLLVSGFDELRASLRERQQEALARQAGLEERVLGFSHEMFAHANEYRSVFQAMVGRRSHAIVQQLLFKILLDLIRNDLQATVPRVRARSIQVEALAQFITGLFESSGERCVTGAFGFGCLDRHFGSADRIAELEQLTCAELTTVRPLDLLDLRGNCPVISVRRGTPRPQPHVLSGPTID